MKYLLDTHAILWYAKGSDELSNTAKSIIENEDCYYNIVSLWEIALKQKLGKLDPQLSIIELENFCKYANFKQIQLKSEYIEHTKRLDFIHKDPFDRLLIANSIVEQMTLITRDSIIPKYDVLTIW